MLWPLYLQENTPPPPVPNGYEGGWGPEPIRTLRRQQSLTLSGIKPRFPACPAHSILVFTLLSYPDPVRASVLLYNFPCFGRPTTEASCKLWKSTWKCNLKQKTLVQNSCYIGHTFLATILWTTTWVQQMSLLGPTEVTDWTAWCINRHHDVCLWGITLEQMRFKKSPRLHM
jgi:hypothetical protein